MARAAGFAPERPELMYNLLLHLYPASFRNEYGEEMRARVRAPARRRRGRSARSASGSRRSSTCSATRRSCTGTCCGRISATPRACCGARPGFAITAVVDRRARHRRDDRGVLGHRLRADPAAAVPGGRSPGEAVREDAGVLAARALGGELSRLESGQHGLREHRPASRRRPATSSASASRCAVDRDRRVGSICFRRFACSR